MGDWGGLWRQQETAKEKQEITRRHWDAERGIIETGRPRGILLEAAGDWERHRGIK